MSHRTAETLHHALALSAAGIEDFLLYFAAAVVITGAYLLIYLWITPYREISLIRQGSLAAAASLSGALIGFTLALASAITESVAFVDMLVWSGVALVIQLLAYAAAHRLMPHLAEDIPHGNTAQGVFLGALHIALGLLNAACMSF